jgi:hypothetical protein
MNIDRIAPGDIVECLRKDRKFHARVTGRNGASLTVVPLTHNCSYYFATAREVRGHWAERPQVDGRPRTRAIRDDDVVAFGAAAAPRYARVLARDRRSLRVQELRSGSVPPTSLTTTDVNTHYARRGRRRPTH